MKGKQKKNSKTPVIEQNRETANFVAIYPQLILKSGIKNEARFAEDILGISRTYLYSIKKGYINAPKYVLYKFIKHFNIPDSNIFGNQTPVVTTNDLNLIKIESLEKEIDLLKEINQLLRDKIRLLEN